MERLKERKVPDLRGREVCQENPYKIIYTAGIISDSNVHTTDRLTLIDPKGIDIPEKIVAHETSHKILGSVITYPAANWIIILIGMSSSYSTVEEQAGMVDLRA